MRNDNQLTLGLFLFGLMAQFEGILSRFQLSADEMFILFYIRHYGKDLGGDKVILRRDVTAVMKQAYGRSEATISKCIGGLLNQGFLSGLHLTDSEKQKLFGTVKSRRLALVLGKKGLKKAAEFSKEVRHLLPVEAVNIADKTLDFLSRSGAS